MRPLTLLSAIVAMSGLVTARNPNYVSKMIGRDVTSPMERAIQQMHAAPREHLQPRATKPSHLNSKTKKFYVDGSKIPDVRFDAGESYAGLLPISSKKNESRELYFWYWPSKNSAAKDEITIWLNGGPGCSSLEGFLQENGPFMWQYGTFLPVPNPWSWTNLTNIVWVEQPVGTGFTQGVATAKTEEDVAEQFLGFFKNLVDTFDLHGKKIYIAGESYAGMYVPHIASAMLDKKDKKYYNLEATMIYDPSINSDAVTEQIPSVAFVDHWSGLFNLNQTTTDYLHKQAKTCGYTDFLNDYLVFPPKGVQPAPPGLNGTAEGCDLFNYIFDAVMLVNPCFDIYQVATTCPILWDVLGFPGSIPYLPNGAKIYFDRPEVKKAINAPNVHWEECSSDNVFNTSSGLSLNAERKVYSSQDVLPGVIERSKRTIIAHGNLDMVLIGNGTLLTIQNMTWNGQLGFQKPPIEDFYVPYHNDYQTATLAGAGVMGKTHTERGLTWVDMAVSGHMGPQYAPSQAYRQMEFLLGRIPSLTSRQPFTTSDQGYAALPDAPQKKSKAASRIMRDHSPQE